MSEEKYRTIINQASEMEKRWNVFTPILTFPLLISMFIFSGIFLTMFGKTVSQSGEELSISVTDIEYSLAIPGIVWFWVAIIAWFFYFCAFIKASRNKINAYRWNSFALLFLMLPTYYSMFYGFQFFVPFLIVRLFYWGLFLYSFAYLFYIIVKRDGADTLVITKEITQRATRVLLICWGLYAMLNVFVNGFSHFIARILLSVLPIFPILIIAVFTGVLRNFFSTLFVLNVIHKDQEHYRKEFGYSVEEWYGKKSKQAKEEARNIK
ncbi:TPA: hypothetical protein ACGOWL_000300 [Streptococcus suis]